MSQVLRDQCPKCGHASAAAPACPRCGLVYARFDPAALDAALSAAPRALWDKLQLTPDDEALNQKFIETCAMTGELPEAARRYRLLVPTRPEAQRWLDVIVKRLSSQLGAVVENDKAQFSDLMLRLRSVLIVVLAVFLLGGLATAVYKMTVR